MRFRVTNNFVEGVFHDVEKALVDFTFAPEEALAVLNPLEITDGDAARVAQNVGHGEDSFGVHNGIGLPRGGAVGAFAENARLDLMRVLLGDLIFDGSGNGDFARLKENVARRHFGSAAGKILERFFLRVDPVDDLGNVKTSFVIEAAADIGETDDLVARLLHELRGERAHVAEALDDNAAAFFFYAEFGERFVAANHHAASGGFAPSGGAAKFNGLAGDYGIGGFADMHGVSVHHPSHSLLVRADVWSGNVALWAQPIGEFGGVAACKTFQFAA